MLVQLDNAIFHVLHVDEKLEFTTAMQKVEHVSVASRWSMSNGHRSDMTTK